MRMKKIITSFIVTATLLSLTGCGGSKAKDSSDGEKKNLTVWVHPYGSASKEKQREIFNEMATDFKKDNPNVTVKFQVIPWANKEQKITTALSSGQGPDVFYLIPDMMPQFAKKGLVEPLDGHFDKKFDKDDFQDSALDAVTYKNKIYGLPILREVQTLIYNTKILDEIGADKNNLPTTWEEFEQLAEKAKKAGYYARNFEGGVAPNFTLYPFIWQAGGDIIKDGKAVINSAAGVKAYEEVYKLYKKGYIPEDSVSTLDQLSIFTEGKSLAVFASGGGIKKIAATKKVDYVIGAPLKDEKQATYGATGMFSVAKTSKNKELATKLVETMTDHDNMINFCKNTGYLPTRDSALDEVKDDEVNNAVGKYLDITYPGVIDPTSRTIIPYIQSSMQAMLEGDLTPKEAANQAADQINAELKK